MQMVLILALYRFDRLKRLSIITNFKNQHMKKYKLIWMAFAIVIISINDLIAQDWNQIVKVCASDRTASDVYSRYTMAMSDEYAIVGATGNDVDANGGSPVTDAGAAYILRNVNGNWQQVQKIVPPDRGSGYNFGFGLAITDHYAFVSANMESVSGVGNAGAVYVFDNQNGTWVFVQKITAPDKQAGDRFGWSLTTYGDYLLIGCPYQSHDRNGANYKIATGSFYSYKNINGVWTFVEQVTAINRVQAEYFGGSLSMYGNWLIVGAWVPGALHTGAVYMFYNLGGMWAQLQKIYSPDIAANDAFGYSVSMYGDYAVAGAPAEDEDAGGGNTLAGAGSAYIYKNISNVWTFQQKIVAADRMGSDYFGVVVAISGDYIYSGASLQNFDANGANQKIDAGAMYIFKKDSASWQQIQKVVAADRMQDDNFGGSITAKNNYIIAGACLQDYDANGGNAKTNAGAAYIFYKCGSPSVPASNLSFGATTATGFMINSFSGSATGADGYVMYINDTNYYTAPDDGLVPSADTLYAGGQQCIYEGASVSPHVWVSGLSVNKEYYVNIYAYKICDSIRLYEKTGYTKAHSTNLYYMISGNTGIAGVTLHYFDSIAQTVTSGVNGDYSIIIPYGWSGTLTPAMQDYIFVPINRDYSNVANDIPDQDFLPVLQDKEINVRQATDIPDGGVFDFGSVNVGETGDTVTFTIENIGNTTLELTGTPVVSVTGSGFLLLTDADSTVGAGDSTTFQVIFTPGACDTNSGSISIANNDTDENPYNFTITGIGLDIVPPVIVTSFHDTSVITGQGCAAVLPDYTSSVVATDNCSGDLVITQVPVAGTLTSGTSNIVTIKVEDEAGNFDEVSFNVAVNIVVSTPAPISVSAGIEPVCQVAGDSLTTTYFTSGANYSGFHWSVSNPAAGSIDSLSGVMTWTDGFYGSLDIRVFAYECGFTTPEVTRSVTIYQLPYVNAGADAVYSCTPVLIGDPANGPGTIAWSPSSGLNDTSISQPLASPTVSTTYVLRINNNGCPASDTVLVAMDDLLHSISGKTKYAAKANNGVPAPNPPTYNAIKYTIDNVIVILKSFPSGTELARDTSDIDGNYRFCGMPDGNYILSYDKYTPDTMQSGNGMDAIDVTLLKYYMGVDTLADPSRNFAATYKKAVNVDNNASINAIDVSRIKAKIGSPNNSLKNFPKGNWVALDTMVTVAGSDLPVNLKTICYGDFNASGTKYRDSAVNWSMLKSVPENIIAVGDDYLVTSDRNFFEVPLHISTKVNEFSALGLELNYPADAYQLVSVTMPGTPNKEQNVRINPTLEEILSADDDLLVTDENGVIRVVFATTDHFDVATNDEIIRLGFRPLRRLAHGEVDFSLSGTGVIGNRYGEENEDACLFIPKVFVQGNNPDPGFEFTGYPNPFKGDVTLTYRTPENGTVHLKVYNATGALVQEIINEPQLSGKHACVFSPANCTSGIYTFKFDFEGKENNKCLIMKMIH